MPVLPEGGPRPLPDAGKLPPSPPQREIVLKEVPALRAEYQRKMSDLIGVFLAFHEERIAGGNLAVALMPEGYLPETDRYVPFDPQVRADDALRRRQRYNPADDFARQVKETAYLSWCQFADRLKGGANDVFSQERGFSMVPPESERFFTPAVSDLLTRAQELHPLASKMSRWSTVSDVMFVGLVTATEVPTQLRAVWGEDYTPTMPHLLAKTGIASANKVPPGIGITCLSDGSAPAQPRPAQYDLLADTPHGLNMERLHEMGFGEADGCPAAKPVSEATSTFLQGLGIRVRSVSTIAFSRLIGESFDRNVTNWYRGLTPEARQKYLDPEIIQLLDGTIRERIRGRSRRS